MLSACEAPSEKRALVVDEWPHMVRLLEVHLQRAGYQVLAAREDETAFRMAKRERPDVVVMFHRWELLISLLEEDPITSHIPVVVVSASDLRTFVFDGRVD